MFCTSCGNTLKETQKFCPKCGTKTKAALANLGTEGISPAVVADPKQQLLEKEAQRKNQENERLTELERQRKEELRIAEAAEKLKQEQKAKENAEKARLEQEQQEATRKQQEEKKRAEEIRAKQEQEAKERAKAEEDERKRAAEIKEPLPDSILLIVRTVLLEHGDFNQIQLDDIYRKARASGISDERTKLNLETELAHHQKRTQPAAAPKEEVAKKKKNRWRPFLIFLSFLIFLCSLVAAGYVFRTEVLDTLDGWGFQTESMRETLGLPSGKSQDESFEQDERGVSIKDEDSYSLPSASDRNGNNGVQVKVSPESIEGVEEPVKRWEKKEEERPGPQRPYKKQTGNAQVQTGTYVKPARASTPEPQVYTIVDEQPVYPGGNKARENFIARNVNYPPEARRQGIAGTVYVSYVVSPVGNVEQVKVVKGVHPLLDAEAVRVVKSIRGYTPGYLGGKAVPVMLQTLIRF